MASPFALEAVVLARSVRRQPRGDVVPVDREGKLRPFLDKTLRRRAWEIPLAIAIDERGPDDVAM
jgi:hypothetical protein